MREGLETRSLKENELMADPMRVGLSAWTEIGWVEIDSATAGFVDDACRSLLGNRVLESTSVLRIQTPG
jgi:hypothetical protein